MLELQEHKYYNPLKQQHQQCSMHPNQEITMYCKEINCKVPVCATCGLLNHRSHDLVELSSAIAKDCVKYTGVFGEIKWKNGRYAV